MLIVIVGAGIVGLHVAAAFRANGHEVFVLEKEPYLGEHTSGRNSGVIHSGIFYTPGSLKERFCIEGNRLTYEWLDRLNVPYRACGKWVVPEEGQEDELEPFYERIRKLSIPPPQLNSEEEVQEKEPLLRKTQAVFVPSTGVLDAAGYVKSLSNYLDNSGVKVVLNCSVMEMTEQTLKTTRGDISFDIAVNSAGLFADEIAKKNGLTDYEIRPCRGDYYLLQRNLIKRPVYHLPYRDAPGLGVHLTPTIDNQLLIGPNAFFIERKSDYQHMTDDTAFQRAVSYFLPKLKDCHFSPAYSGNRPKLFFKDKACSDFVIFRKANWIHLLGIESPGLTAAPALAREVLKLL